MKILRKYPYAFYKSLSLKNFRCFRNCKKIPLAPLTFLVGPNSAGKSSISDAILLLSQSNFMSTGNNIIFPHWGGHLVDLGSYEDAVYGHKTSLPLDISIEISNPSIPQKAHVEIKFGLKTTKNDPIGKLKSITITDSITNKSLIIKYLISAISLEFLNIKKVFRIGIKSRSDSQLYRNSFYMYKDINLLQRFFNDLIKDENNIIKGYKSACKRIEETFLYSYRPLMVEVERVASGRAAPRRWYSISEMTDSSRLVPNYYRYASRVYSEVEPRLLSDQQIPYIFKNKRRRRKRINLQEALKKLDIASSINSSDVSPYHSAIKIEDSVTGIKSNLIDVGYGASQVIPVIRAIMSPGRGPLLIEQPEIHLHPKAQAELSEILCETSIDRQVIIETHSVHMINRARILVAEGKISPDQVIINFVYREKNGSHIHSIPILEDGDFACEWPSNYGFFDERYQDTMRLLHLKNSK
ncbi:DUF3696 domain-containing protein [Candidatus Latescibacterota bacterium]